MAVAYVQTSHFLRCLMCFMSLNPRSTLSAFQMNAPIDRKGLNSPLIQLNSFSLHQISFNLRPFARSIRPVHTPVAQCSRRLLSQLKVTNIEFTASPMHDQKSMSNWNCLVCCGCNKKLPGWSVKSPSNPAGPGSPHQGSKQMNGAPGNVQRAN